MSDSLNLGFTLPPEQQAIRDKCFHPSGTFVEFPIEDVQTSIPARFEKIVKMYPHRIAVKTADESITYEALNQSANRLANVILACVENTDAPVAVILRPGIAQCAAILAVLKAGKILLLQDSRSDSDEVDHFLTDSQAGLILRSEKNKWSLTERAATSSRVVDIETSNIDSENPRILIHPDTPAYIKYTSGSSGRAKGIVISHRTLLHRVMTYTNSCHFSAQDRLVRVNRNTISRQLFIHLLNGATYCPYDFDSEGLHHLAIWMKTRAITIYRSFPGVFRLLVSSLAGQERLTTLRLIRLGGEPLYRSDVELFNRHFSSDCVLIHSYAASETGLISTYYLDHNMKILGHRVPVGYPVSGKNVSIIDTDGNELPVDQTGEIAVKSRFLSAGYWRRGEDTSNTFESSAVGSETKLYRTGDLGRLSNDGCLEHLGRKDDRIKIRNFRVDIGEVEAKLMEHPEVKLAVVTAKEDASGDARLVAYFVPQDLPAPTVTVLREFLSASLPSYMVPSVFIALAELPLTKNGKIDRRNLPTPGKRRPNLATPFVEPTSTIQTKLAGIWKDVLALDQVGIDDNFFDLGGHSLTAAQIISRLIQAFQLELPLKSLFQAPTIAEMAAIIAEHQGENLTVQAMERVLSEIESMSDDEAQRIVAKEV